MSPSSAFFPPFLLFIALVGRAGSAGSAELNLEHVGVTYNGIGEEYARAIARTVAVSRATCSQKFGYDMPETIRVTVTADPQQRVRLFNDGVDVFSLSVRSEADLKKPAISGIFHIYGLCHEVAHLAMYRPIKDHSWLSTAGAEGWAHYLGSVLVDELYASQGESLWPDAYDYRADGTRRLDEQLAKRNASETAQAAGQWRELTQLVGAEKMPALFSSWGKAEISPSHPEVPLRTELAKFTTDARLASWWHQAEPLLLIKREPSQFPKRQTTLDKLTAAPRILSHEDGQAAGKSSIAGGGHAVRFQVPDVSWYLTAVEIYGSRYGSPAPPKENFRVWLCDEKLNAVAEFAFPYAKFPRGQAEWVKLPVAPTQVPRDFILCVGFNPAATKGVFVHYGKPGKHSLTGLPGTSPREFTRGQWLIRAHVDQLREADSLKFDR